jgi:hypothetical protein
MVNTYVISSQIGKHRTIIRMFMQKFGEVIFNFRGIGGYKQPEIGFC